MTGYIADESGAPLCADCATDQCPPVDGWRCEAEHCQCLCKADIWPDDADRARELDDRPDDKLAVVAAELDRERTPDVRELTAERYGRGGR